MNDKVLKNSLKKQGFTGELTGRVTFTHLGSLECGAKSMSVFYYEWEESNPPGLAIHQSMRIVFLEKNKYLGSYSVEDRPSKVGPDSLQFDYPKNLGNQIKCGGNGLPQHVVLNGELDALAN